MEEIGGEIWVIRYILLMLISMGLSPLLTNIIDSFVLSLTEDQYCYGCFLLPALVIFSALMHAFIATF